MATARRIVMFNRVTADGYFATADGALDWVVPDAEMDAAIGLRIAHLPGRGAALFGRRTYEMFAGFWPRVLEQGRAATNPHAPGEQSEVMHAMAVWLDEADKLVFSTTLAEPSWRNTRVVRSLDPGAVEAMKREQGSDIMIFGSGSVVSQLTQHGLIDEYHFVVSPVLLGAGQSLVREVTTRTPLTLREATAHPSGNVTLRYAPQR